MNVEQFHARLNELYLPAEGGFSLVDVPEIRYAVIDGSGDPGKHGRSAEAAKWLYSVAHFVKPYIKERMGRHFAMPPLEYQFWADSETDFIAGRKERWHWRAMLVFVDWITEERFQEAVASVAARRGRAPETLRLENLREGRCVQVLHVGEYEKVAAVCEELYRTFLPANGLQPNGPYHEIYLNDPARTAPHRRKVVIRQPVK